VLVLLPTEGAGWYLDTLVAEGMEVAVHSCPGRVRESIIVIEDDGRVTVLNGTGAPVDAEAWDAFLDAAVERLDPPDRDAGRPVAAGLGLSETMARADHRRCAACHAPIGAFRNCVTDAGGHSRA